MDDEFLVLLLGSSPWLGCPRVVGINVLLGDLGAEYRGEKIHRILLGDIHYDLVVRIGQDIVLEFLTDRPQLAQAVVGQEEANVRFPAKGYEVVQTRIGGGVELVEKDEKGLLGLLDKPVPDDPRQVNEG